MSAAAPAEAQPQTWLPDRRYREGAGYRVGDFELHPGVGASFGFDSNFFRRSGNELEPIGRALRLLISPSFSVSTLGASRMEGAPPPSVRFRADLTATYSEFFPVAGPEGVQQVLQDQRNLEGNVGLRADILPQRTWSGSIAAGLSRTVRPTNEGDTSQSFNRLTPTAGGELVWTPGSGLLDWRLGYRFTGTFFEASSAAALSNIKNDITTRGRWRFYPHTALLYDASFGFIGYPDGASGRTNKGSSHPLRARLGVNGLFTNSFGVLAMVGWGASFYERDDAQDFDSVIGQLELKWYFTPTLDGDPMKTSTAQSGLALGFRREFDDSYMGTYLERDQGYFRFDYLFGGKFLLAGEASGGAVVFPIQNNPDLGNPEGWTDVRVDGKLFGEYRIKSYLGINADVQYTGYFSDTIITFANDSGTTVQDELAYQEFRAYLGARWFM